jgi:hypothetical protein
LDAGVPLIPRYAALLAVVVGLLAAVPAEAATITPAQHCYRYSPDLAGQRWVGISGSGFSPNSDPALNSLRFDWPDVVAGFTHLASDGSFNTSLLMPIDFIDHRAGLIKRYTLRATDLNNPALTASTDLVFVRAGVTARPSRVGRRLHRRVAWSAYGAPTSAKLFIHWTFRGRRLATRGLGRAKGNCGIAHKRLPFLPVAGHRGTFKVYVTKGPRLKRKALLFGVSVHVL